jgi:DNA-binding MarR family transcriptional regulator
MNELCNLRKLIVDLRRFEEKLKKKTGLTVNEALLLCLVQRKKQEPTLLAEELDLSPSRLSRILDSLEKKNFISRKISSEDRRSVSVNLTTLGLEAANEINCTNIKLPEYLKVAIESLTGAKK